MLAHLAQIRLKEWATILPAAMSLAIAACSSQPTSILESDVPLVPETQVRQSVGAVVKGGALMSGRFICFGTMTSAEEARGAADSRFADRGWGLWTRTTSRDRIQTTYFKQGRHVDVLIEFNSIDPQMSRAVIEVKPEPAPQSPPAAPPAPAPPAGR